MPIHGPVPSVVATPSHRLTHDVDVWVASASADGAPYLVPLSFDWGGEALLMATPTDSPTAETWPVPAPFGWGWGGTRDVSMIEGDVEVLEIDALLQEQGTGSPRTPASTRVRWPLRIVGSASRPAASGRGTR